ncbi:TetR/AcrR family transcriptional regulator [Crossiella sp. CA-258035]|uniref:TetR/AcrR family transcriptional regulator n=1 Tax=Crossiella sp. CA-258035 TaxID=2981138 RepID=UPI0024BD062D|nr:TetR/AcrR family transcriptional regulator [Crossiella sp. CA-258035]WHT16103.1 TetR/AcrR family transcriptional regulator [Crossiella sp. CA-258035]
MVTGKGAATRGREGFLLDAVLKATGTSKGQLFHYFPRGREELLEAAAARQIERCLAHLRHRYGEFDTWARWQSWVDDLSTSHQLDQAGEFASLAGRAIEPEPRLRRLAGRAYQDLIELQADGLRAMRARGDLLPTADPDALAAMMVCTLQGGVVVHRATGSRQHLAAALQGALAHLRGFAAATGNAPGRASGDVRKARSRSARA